MSLYRKYRPAKFADVYGQEHVVTTLENATENGTLVHAYLFSGSRGTGKTSVARILAKTIMTQGIADKAVCKQIEKGIEEGSIVDLLEIDAASNTGVDNIRDLIEKIQFSPVAAAAKVYIIDEVHMLSKGAFNALLKTLEEPPAYAYFILATTELNKIPATIRSRCQCFPFRRIREEDIIRRLQFIADSERIVIDREALRLIAHACEGGMRDAISLLDQMRSLPKITLDEVGLRLGTTGSEAVQTVLKAVAEQSAPEIIETVRSIEESGIAPEVFARQILTALREDMHAAVEAHESSAPHVAILDTLLGAIRDMRSSPVPGLVLEAALLSLAQDRDVPAPPRIAVKAAEPPVVKKEPAKKTEPAEARTVKDAPVAKSAGTVEAPELSLENLLDAWPSLLKDVAPASVKMSLKNGRVTGIGGDSVTVQFSSAFHRDRVKETNASRGIEELLQRIFKKNLKLHCTIDDAAIPGDARSDELVNVAEAAAELF
ncbi:DNA polymerase III subunit gamma/tau [Candidatus Peregrinibacteria bacterium]|nr:DNA polymerase III subunit gamma/tau [Candidatus Peregrinibacteria bacterium]